MRVDRFVPTQNIVKELFKKHVLTEEGASSSDGG